MEGPTPVSSLLHAATMVTAGVFLITRCNIFFYFSYTIPIYIIFIGSTTSLFASLIGFFQNDLKKVVAYSTCSQLLRPNRSLTFRIFADEDDDHDSSGLSRVGQINESVSLGLVNSVL